MRRSAGKISIAQVVIVAGIVVGGYFGVKYLPVISQKAAASDIARTAAAKMVVEPNDQVIREFIQAQATKKGLQLPQSEMAVRRNYPSQGTYTVELGWTYQMKHVWGANKVMRLKVSETADPPDTRILKNAE